MLRIERSTNPNVVLTLSGQIEVEDVQELKRLLALEIDHNVVLDLRDVTLLDRDAVNFLACCEADNIKLENCPAYIRKWIECERGRDNRPKH